MLSPRYQNSECKGGYLHKFRQLYQTMTGYVERCERCGLQMHFPITPEANHYYLSYHIREVLRAEDALFAHEYPNAI